MSKLLSQSWKDWTRENYELGIPPTKIFEILVNHDFDLKDIENELTSLKNEKKVDKTKDSSIKQSNTHIQNSIKVEIENNVLDLYKIDNFLSNEVCKKLTSIIKANKVKSEVSNAKKADGYVSSTRTSSTCNLVENMDSVVRDVDNKILECIGIHQSRGESIQGQHYDKTQEFKPHTDTFQPNSEEYDLHCLNRGGQRTWTFMIYLNSTEEGGETKFNKVKGVDGSEVIFKPKTGMALVWNNLKPDGTPNFYSLHQGCPVISGEKTIITKWFRERKI